MPIFFDDANRSWHIQDRETSYIFSCGQDCMPHHLYWGKHLTHVPVNMHDRVNYRRAGQLANVWPDDPHYSREFYHYECPHYGTSDFRVPAIEIEDLETGTDTMNLKYVSSRIFAGKDGPLGMPSARGESIETLELVFADEQRSAKVTLYYSLLTDSDVLVRRMRIENIGKKRLRIRQAMSASVDFEDGTFTLLTPDGQQLREFTPTLRTLEAGLTQIDSTRGISSHNHKPMALLLRPGADEDHGDVYAVSLVYSGNFALRFEIDAFHALRMQAGINPFQFSWQLEPGALFDTPECVLAYCGHGINGVSEKLHHFVRHHLLRPCREQLPVLLNTWEACYFNVSREKLTRIADLAAPRGIELLVLDDGWFGHRSDASSSLGDWICNEQKFPGGFPALGRDMEARGMKLGIWVEPEMISPDSELYRAHPDWCVHVDGRPRTLWRNQLVLDLTRIEIQDAIISALDTLLHTGCFSYVKWDNNRRLTELFSPSLPPQRQMEFSHRYMLGVYRILQTVTEKYPDVLFENCASGGGRFDYGMYAYFNQGWVSDNTDPECRLMIQNCASMFFPPEVITSHISASPNHQTSRATPFAFRRDVSMLFNLGFELNPEDLSADDLDSMRQAAQEYAKARKRFSQSRFFRLTETPVPNTWYGWERISEDANWVEVAYFRANCEIEPAFWQLRLKGLATDASYRLEGTEQVYLGSDLMHYGLQLPWHNGDDYCYRVCLRRCQDGTADA